MPVFDRIAAPRIDIFDDKYHFDSVGYTNIVIQDVRILPQGTRDTT